MIRLGFTVRGTIRFQYVEILFGNDPQSCSHLVCKKKKTLNLLLCRIRSSLRFVCHFEESMSRDHCCIDLTLCGTHGSPVGEAGLHGFSVFAAVLRT